MHTSGAPLGGQPHLRQVTPLQLQPQPPPNRRRTPPASHQLPPPPPIPQHSLARDWHPWLDGSHFDHCQNRWQDRPGFRDISELPQWAADAGFDLAAKDVQLLDGFTAGMEPLTHSLVLWECERAGVIGIEDQTYSVSMSGLEKVFARFSGAYAQCVLAHMTSGVEKSVDGTVLRFSLVLNGPPLPADPQKSAALCSAQTSGWHQVMKGRGLLSKSVRVVQHANAACAPETVTRASIAFSQTGNKDGKPASFDFSTEKGKWAWAMNEIGSGHHELSQVRYICRDPSKHSLASWAVST